MSGSLNHSTADVVRYLLVSLGVGTLPEANGAWPIFSGREPDNPDNVITVYETQGRTQGRFMATGVVQEQYGFQIRIRATTLSIGGAKASAIETALDTSVKRSPVTIGSATYLVHAVTRVGRALSLGKESPTSRRNLFTLNVLATISQTS